MSSFGQGSGRGRPFGGGRDPDRPSNSRKRPAAATATDDLNEAWFADEDNFMLQQQKKKAEFRVKRGIAKPIDHLAIGLRFIDPTRKIAEDEVADTDLDFVSPEDVFKNLSKAQLDELDADLKLFLPFETAPTNKDFWETMAAACDDRRNPPVILGRNFSFIDNSAHKLLASKPLSKLIDMERQLETKLALPETDVEWWTSAKNALLSHKARKMLEHVSKEVVDARTERLKALGQDPAEYPPADGPAAKRFKSEAELSSSKKPEPASQTAQHSLQYDREVARGLGENEEVFADEVPVETVGLSEWQDKHRPRKPLYFNRVNMGYEWNKYNQSHYTAEDPPPRKPQGYRFVLFLPELVDPLKTPRYKIEREGGRKQGETFAPAGEDDMCIIRFTCGAPYEDIAFRIVDRTWDHSAKQRGFKAEFRDGILEVSFFFKKVPPNEPCGPRTIFKSGFY